MDDYLFENDLDEFNAEKNMWYLTYFLLKNFDS